MPVPWRRALCENKRAKIKFIDSAAKVNDAISAVGDIVEILEENLERVEFSQQRQRAIVLGIGKKAIRPNQRGNRSESYPQM